jgi:hypothetical protein
MFSGRDGIHNEKYRENGGSVKKRIFSFEKSDNISFGESIFFYNIKI